LTESEKDIEGENMKTAVATKEKPAKQNKIFLKKTRHRQKLALLTQSGISCNWSTNTSKLKNDFYQKN